MRQSVGSRIRANGNQARATDQALFGAQILRVSGLGLEILGRENRSQAQIGLPS